MKTRYTENSNLEAIYLLGEFGVQLDGTRRRIIPIAETVEIGDLCEQGFPFYSGVITYVVPIPERARRLRLPQTGGACVKVNDQVLGWDPFEADISDVEGVVNIEVILTRRNTFGPLHDAAHEFRQHNGPDHWLTENDEFSMDCIFLPSGLLDPPLCLVNCEVEV